MKAAQVFIAFFLVFTAASIAVPVPLFPGNLVTSFFHIPYIEYIIYIEAITNGIAYGLVIWLIFFLIIKKLDKSDTIDPKKHLLQ
jgi:hypothetical protein